MPIGLSSLRPINIRGNFTPSSKRGRLNLPQNKTRTFYKKIIFELSAKSNIFSLFISKIHFSSL